MSGTGRRTPRTGAGPGRGSPRTRTAARTSARSTSRTAGTARAENASTSSGSTPGSAASGSARSGSTSATSAPTRSAAGEALVGRARSVGITRRAVALVAVMLVLILSFAQSLRVYTNQQRDMATAEAEIAQRQQRIAELQDELTRWQDPSYVRIQARQRLGWVVPGETGYVVLGPDGKPIDGSNEIDSKRPDGEQPDADAWWARMWGSVQTADKPAPAPADSTEKPKAEKSPR